MSLHFYFCFSQYNEAEYEKADKINCRIKFNCSAQDYHQSILLFTKALSLDPSNPIFWTNRAMAKMKLEEFGGAASDASHAIDIDHACVKAYYRRALSRLAILKPTQAVPDFRMVLKLDPTNAIARKQLEETLKLIRRIEFEKAISVGEQEKISKKIIDMIKTDAVPMDKGYEGPMPNYNEVDGRYEPTKDFVEGLIEMFKDGGKLPRRLCWEIILGCKNAVEAELSMVETTIEKGVVCDVVGDTHGVSLAIRKIIRRFNSWTTG